ncbi:MAG TPA: universal stress protein [Chloroflexi bacterium]|nr:universal stress protein [Chloroflexota bacterium]
MFDCIIYATDGSEHAREALAYARDLAKLHQTRLYIVHAYAPLVDLKNFGNYDEIIALRIAQGHEILDAALEELVPHGIDVHTELLEGPMAEAIIRIAEVRDADLIIIGARGLSSFQGLLLGSVSQKVIQYAPCPVLVVR